MKMTGKQAFFECLLEQGVDTIFGYPGGQVIPLYDEMVNFKDRIQHYLTSHEQGASHAADGYARSSGKVGVCIATSGPGATNLVTGIATAYMDSIPVVFFTGNVPVAQIGTDSFQEVDITGITMPITKYNWMVKDAQSLPRIIREAFRVAQEGRPGPVLVDIPKDMTTTVIDYEPACPAPKDGRQAREEAYEAAFGAQLDEAAEIIAKAQRPYLLVGGGMVKSGCSDVLVEMAEKLQAPVSCTLMGLGTFPCSHRLNVGNLGMHGTRAANTASAECDLLLAIGTRFNDRITGKIDRFATAAHVVHIDIDRAEINKNIVTGHHLVGDAGVIVSLLNKRLAKKDENAWTEGLIAMKERVEDYAFRGMSPYSVLRTLHDVVGDDAYIATDVGQHQMWTAQYYPFEKPGRLLTSGGLGTMGFGLGAAVGAQAAHPEGTVALITGDGSFRMNCNELAVVGHYNLPVIIVIMNNGVLGMVRQWQTLLFEKRYSNTTLDRGPDFVKLAEAYGIDGYRITSPQEFRARVEEAVRERKPVILDCVMDKDEMVHPMVGPGQPLTEFLLD